MLGRPDCRVTLLRLGPVSTPGKREGFHPRGRRQIKPKLRKAVLGGAWPAVVLGAALPRTP